MLRRKKDAFCGYSILFSHFNSKIKLE